MFPEKYYYLKVAQSSDLKDKKERIIYRLLEIFPAFLVWITLTVLVIFSWIAPFEVAIFIIAFDIYWFVKTLYLTLHLRSSYKKVREEFSLQTSLSKKPPDLGGDQ